MLRPMPGPLVTLPPGLPARLLRPLLAVGFAAVAVATPAPAVAMAGAEAVAEVGAADSGEPMVMLADSCVEPRYPEFEMFLRLTGDSVLLPSSLKTTVFFDPGLMEPYGTKQRPEIEPGPFYGSVQPMFSHETDADAGRVDLVFNSEGRRPVASLPAGALATLRFRLRSQAPRNGVLRVDLDPGETVSLDGNGRQMFTATAGPAYVWIGHTGPSINVGTEGENIIIRAGAPLVRGKAWIVRGSMRQVNSSRHAVRFGPLEVLPGQTDALQAIDDEIPEVGDAFFYVAAQPDSSGRPVLGFGSDCQTRVVAP